MSRLISATRPDYRHTPTRLTYRPLPDPTPSDTILFSLPAESLTNILGNLDLRSLACLHSCSNSMSVAVADFLNHAQHFKHEPRPATSSVYKTFKLTYYPDYNDSGVNSPLHFLARHTGKLKYLDLSTTDTGTCHLNPHVVSDLLNKNRNLELLDISGINIMLRTAREISDHASLKEVRYERGGLYETDTEFYYETTYHYIRPVTRENGKFLP